MPGSHGTLRARPRGTRHDCGPISPNVSRTGAYEHPGGSVRREERARARKRARANKNKRAQTRGDERQIGASSPLPRPRDACCHRIWPQRVPGTQRGRSGARCVPPRGAAAPRSAPRRLKITKPRAQEPPRSFQARPWGTATPSDARGTVRVRITHGRASWRRQARRPALSARRRAPATHAPTSPTLSRRRWVAARRTDGVEVARGEGGVVVLIAQIAAVGGVVRRQPRKGRHLGQRTICRCPLGSRSARRAGGAARLAAGKPPNTQHRRAGARPAVLHARTRAHARLV